jgi:hypothetical protein
LNEVLRIVQERAEEVARVAERHRSELGGAVAAAKAREAEARQRTEAAEKRMAQVTAVPSVLIPIDEKTLQRTQQRYTRSLFPGKAPPPAALMPDGFAVTA